MIREKPIILLVEADSAVRQSFIGLVDNKRFTVLEAESAAQGLAKAKSDRPDFLFLDVSMGMEFIRLIGSEFPETLIAVLGAAQQEQSVLDAMKAGARDYLWKPFSEMGLCSTLSHLTGISARRRNRVFRPGLLSSARLEFEIESSERAFGPAVEWLRALLRGFLDIGDLNRVELGLHEVLQNAHEHGNLGIGYGEKGELCVAEQLEESRRERAAMARTEAKKIRILAQLSEGSFICTVEDDGPGFDWRNLPALEDASAALHGRGIMLVRRMFDEVRFNETGNAVELTKRLPRF